MGDIKDILRNIVFQLERKELLYIFKRKLDINGLDDLDMKMRIIRHIDDGKAFDLDRFKGKMGNLSAIYCRKKDAKKVGRINRLLLKLGDNAPATYNNAAVDLMEDGRNEEAVIYFGFAYRNLIKNDRYDRSFPGYLSNLLVCLSGLEEHGQIISTCEETISSIGGKKVDPEVKDKISLLAYREMGEALIMECRYGEALGAIMKSYMIDPSDNDTKLALAKYYEAVDDFATVKILCREVIAKDKENNPAYFRLAMAHIFSGEREEARQYLIEAYRSDPNDKATKENLLQCLYELGRIKVFTNCDEVKYIEELVESGEGDRIIQGEIEENKADETRAKLERMFLI